MIISIMIMIIMKYIILMKIIGVAYKLYRFKDRRYKMFK